MMKYLALKIFAGKYLGLPPFDAMFVQKIPIEVFLARTLLFVSGFSTYCDKLNA